MQYVCNVQIVRPRLSTIKNYLLNEVGVETLSDLKDVYGDQDIMSAIKMSCASQLEFKRFKDAASRTTILRDAANISGSPTSVLSPGL